MSDVCQPGDEVPASGRYTFVNVWGTECGWIYLRKGEIFPAIQPKKEYRFFLRRKPRDTVSVLRLAA